MERFEMKLTATQKSETKKDFPQWSQKFCDRVSRQQPSQKISRNDILKRRNDERKRRTALKSQNHNLTRKKCSNPMNSWWNDDHRLVLTKHGVLEKEKILLNSNMHDSMSCEIAHDMLEKERTMLDALYSSISWLHPMRQESNGLNVSQKPKTFSESTAFFHSSIFLSSIPSCFPLKTF